MKILIGAVVLTILALAGCGAGQAPGGTAARQGGFDPDKAVKYVKCMREHDIPLRLDDGEGDRGIALEGEEPEPAKLDAAKKACARFDPFGPGPSVGTEEWDLLVKRAQCLRRHGVDVADPQPGDNGIKIESKVDEQTAEKAEDACRKYAGPKPKPRP